MNSVIDHLHEKIVYFNIIRILPFNFCFRLDNFGVFDASWPTECTKTQTGSVNTFRKTVEKDPKIIKKRYTIKLVFQTYNKTHNNLTIKFADLSYQC